jgi:hypothetical protein
MQQIRNNINRAKHGYKATVQGSHDSRIDENGVKTKKLRLKHGSRGLFIKDLKLKGLWTKKLRAKI